MTPVEQINIDEKYRNQMIQLADSGNTQAMRVLGAAYEAQATPDSIVQSVIWYKKAYDAGDIEAGFFCARNAMTMALFFEKTGDEKGQHTFWMAAFEQAGGCYNKLPGTPENAEIGLASEKIYREATYQLALEGYLDVDREKMGLFAKHYDVFTNWNDNKERLLYLDYSLHLKLDEERLFLLLNEYFELLTGSYVSRDGVGKGSEKEQRFLAGTSRFAYMLLKSGRLVDFAEKYDPERFIERVKQALTSQDALTDLENLMKPE